ncbi:MFS transporter [soil metagenome]
MRHRNGCDLHLSAARVTARQPTEAAAPTASGQDPPGRWKGLAILAVAMLLAMTTWFSATAVVPQLEAEWSLSSAQSAWLTIAVQLGFVAGAVASAVLGLADRIPPRRLMLYGAIGAAGCNVLLLTGPPVILAAVLRAGTGACLAGVYPPAMKVMATWFRYGRGTALGVMVGALTLGSATPHLVNGLGGLDWRIVITTTSALTVAGGAIAEFTGEDGPFPFPSGSFDLNQAWKASTSRGVLLASAGYFGHMWELYAMWAWFAVFYRQVLQDAGVGDPGRDAALATFAVIGVGALGCLAGGVLGDRWGRSNTTSLSMAISGTCAILIGLTLTLPPIVALIIGLVWGFWVVADSAQFSTVVTEVVDQEYVGTAVTLQLAVGFTLTVATLWLVPVLVDALTWRWAFAVLAIGPAGGIIAMLRLRGLPEAARIAGGSG